SSATGGRAGNVGSRTAAPHSALRAATGAAGADYAGAEAVAGTGRSRGPAVTGCDIAGGSAHFLRSRRAADEDGNGALGLDEAGREDLVVAMWAAARSATEASVPLLPDLN